MKAEPLGMSYRRKEIIDTKSQEVELVVASQQKFFEKEKN